MLGAVMVLHSNYLDDNRRHFAPVLVKRLELELGFLAERRMTPMQRGGRHCHRRGTAHCQTCSRDCRAHLL